MVTEVLSYSLGNQLYFFQVLFLQTFLADVGEGVTGHVGENGTPVGIGGATLDAPISTSGVRHLLDGFLRYGFPT